LSNITSNCLNKLVIGLAAPESKAPKKCLFENLSMTPIQASKKENEDAVEFILIFIGTSYK